VFRHGAMTPIGSKRGPPYQTDRFIHHFDGIFAVGRGHYSKPIACQNGPMKRPLFQLATPTLSAHRHLNTPPRSALTCSYEPSSILEMPHSMVSACNLADHPEAATGGVGLSRTDGYVKVYTLVFKRPPEPLDMLTSPSPRLLKALPQRHVSDAGTTDLVRRIDHQITQGGVGKYSCDAEFLRQAAHISAPI
jgi:hypothetical protein